MKRIVFLAAMLFIMPGPSVVFAQADADNFYHSNSVNVQKVSFDNQDSLSIDLSFWGDLSDRVGLIPFNKLESFFKEYLK